LRLNYKIKSELDDIKLAISNSQYKYVPGVGIIPKNATASNEGTSTQNIKKTTDNARPISYYQGRISSLESKSKQYDPILKKDSAILKEASRISWLKMRNKESVKTDIDAARLTLYNDGAPVRAINDSIAYYKTQISKVSSK
jgi:hypothetical protein